MSNRSPIHSPNADRRTWLLVALAVWISGFLLAFFRQTLPNNPQFTRHDIWLELADQILGGNNGPAANAPPLWTMRGFNDRLPMIIHGLSLFVAAWLMGTAFQRLLRRFPSWWPADFFTKTEVFILQAGVGLTLLSTWVLLIGLAAQLSVTAVFAPACVAVCFLLVERFRHQPLSTPEVSDEPSTQLVAPKSLLWSRSEKLLLYGVLLPFAVYLLLGSLTPSSDFDVREYHLQGPKEWFQAGRIYFLRHNVYTSFPFLTEMISLAGMVVTGDPWKGSLAGQFVLAMYAVLTTLTVFSIARRLGGNTVGLIAAILHFTTPWTLRISIIALVEGGLSFYLAATALLVICSVHAKIDVSRQRGIWLVIGVLSGSGMACKYTGLLSVILPAVVFLFTALVPALRTSQSQPATNLPRQVAANGLAFGLGVLLVMGPWFYRNAMDTQNPVYPLADSLFHSPEWNQEIAVRWKPAHSPSDHNILRIPQHFLDVALRNDWSSGILFALCVPAFFAVYRKSAALSLGVLILWQFFSWWAFTHRIDRFWVPAIPLVAAFSSMAWSLDRSRIWRCFLVLAIGVATVFNLQFCRLPLIGFHSRLMSLADAQKQVVRSDFEFLNDQLPGKSRVLMVGEAEVFDARFDLIYNTVFDDSIFEELVAADPDSASASEFPKLKAASEIRNNLQRAGITHVLVNWNEILRYRLPGSYGYTPWVQPRRFAELQELGILHDAHQLSWRSWDDLSDQERATIMSWEGTDGLRPNPNVFSSIMLYEVRLN